MPKRDDIHCVMIIGSGPIVIGQGCEFDYSGTQACKALREEGIRIVLLNSNPATIMTDPEMADRTYIEPITPASIDRILTLERERGTPVDSLLPTLGGQTGLNCAVEAMDAGILQRHGVRLIGANYEAIQKAEGRTEFKQAMLRIGLDVPRSGIAHTWEQAQQIIKEIGLPVAIRPAYTLGGTGGGFAHTPEEFETIAKRGLEYSRISEILIEESCLGWKEYELEVMRDRADNVVIICSIENLDPMGVHTGDSITVAPAQTLTDKEYQLMRDASIRIIREIGVDTGGSNIQFAVHPKTGRMVVVEMNPRVSRSSALASKATGYPIAKIAAKLAIGYTLNEIPNDITRKTPASFEPTIDYCVVKIPRWTFEKFPEADETLTTQMKSVGEAMAIGRTFKEALQKGIRSMEIKRFGLGLDANDLWLKAQKTKTAKGKKQKSEPETLATGQLPIAEPALLAGPRNAEPPADTQEQSAVEWPIPLDVLRDKLIRPCQGRLYYVRYAFKMGWTVEQVQELTHIDPWFLDNIKDLVDFESAIDGLGQKHSQAIREVMELASENADLHNELRSVIEKAKQWGYSDVQLATILNVSPLHIRDYCRRMVLHTAYKLVDTCAAEFEAYTPYYYSTSESPVRRLKAPGSGSVAESRVDDEIRVSNKPKVVILGGGPNRIGQGIEFDYCCVHAVMAAREMGYETVMVNSNPETVSTDYDTSDLLFFEPLTHEDVLNICERLNNAPLVAGEGAQGRLKGVVVQFGGQTPLNLALGLKKAGAPILGTSPASIHLAEDRDEFAKILKELGLLQPANGIAYDLKGAKKIAKELGYPVLVRPSYVLGGRGMQKCNIEEDLVRYMKNALQATDRTTSAGEKHPILIDKFLDEALEIDVDAISDGTSTVVCGVMEHIEEAGIHSGDSACMLPPYSIPPIRIDALKRQTESLAKRLGVRGLMNIQFAMKNDVIYVLEVNPRASRTVPFVSKATGVPWAKMATKIMLGKSLEEVMREQGLRKAPIPQHYSVKEAVFPFSKFPGVDCVLGPEMRSTGEVMGIDDSFAMAFAKAELAAGTALPTQGTIVISVNDHDKPLIVSVARDFAAMGFKLLSTAKTCEILAEWGVDAELVSKTPDGPNYIVDLINAGQIDLLINTPIYRDSAMVEARIRSAAVMHNVPLITTMAGVRASLVAIQAMRSNVWTVRAVQDFHADLHG